MTRELTFLILLITTLLGIASFGDGIALGQSSIDLQKIPAEKHGAIQKCVVQLKQVGDLHRNARDQEALPIAEEVVNQFSSVLGRQHPATAQAMNDLAAIHFGLGDLSKAAEFHQQALEIRQKTFPADSLEIADSHYNLGEVLDWLGRSEDALMHHQRAFESRQASAPDSAPTAQSGMELGRLLNQAGRWTEARPVLRSALNWNREKIGVNHPDTVDTMIELAVAHQHLGDLVAARELLKSASDSGKQHLTPERMSQLLVDLGSVLFDLNDYPESMKRLEQARYVQTQFLDSNHPQHLATLTQTAEVAEAMKKYAVAKSYWQRALQLQENTLGDKYGALATRIRLARVAIAAKQYTRARSIIVEVLAVRRRTLGRHVDTAESHLMLGQVLDVMGEHAEAGRQLGKALELRLELLGELHPLSIDAEVELAIHHAKRDDLLDASKLFDAALRHYQRLSESSDATLRAAATSRQEVLSKSLSFAIEHSDNASVTRMATEWIFNTKDAPNSGSIHWASLAEVRSALGSDRVLVEYVRLRRHPLDDFELNEETSSKTNSYLAWIIPGNAAEPISVVDLGPAAAVEEKVSNLHAKLADANDRVIAGQEESEPNEVASIALTEMRDLLWAPIESKLKDSPGNRPVVLAPDGDLSLLPWFTAPDITSTRIAPVETPSLILDRSVEVINSVRELTGN